MQSVIKLIVKIQMFFAVRAAKRQVRKDIAIEESHTLITGEEWEEAYGLMLEETLAKIDLQQEEMKEIKKKGLASFAGYPVKLEEDYDFVFRDIAFAGSSWDIPTNTPNGDIGVNSFLARREGTRKYNAIMWHEVGHLVDPDMDIRRYTMEDDYRHKKEVYADLLSCEKGYGLELIEILVDLKDKFYLFDQATMESLDIRIIAITSYLSREK